MSVQGQRTNPAQSTSGIQQRRPTITEGEKVKVNKLDEYHGDRGKLEDWLTQVELYFAFHPVQEDRKTLFASTFLRGRAERWIRPRTRQYLDNSKDPGIIFGNFSNFKREVRRMFRITNEDR